jgi:hypothetical protein
MQISGVSLALTWPPQALFTQSSPVHEPLLQAFPFLSTLGEVTLHLLSQASMFIYSSCGKWVFPPLLWSFPPTTAFTNFPTLDCWACAAAPAFWGLCVYLQFHEGLPLPLLRCSGRPALFAMCLFCYCLLFRFFFSLFFPGWWSVCLGGYADLAQGCLWEYHMPLSSPCGLRLPKRSGSWRLVAWEPSWFLLLTWSRDAMCGLGVWRSQTFSSSLWFFL